MIHLLFLSILILLLCFAPKEGFYSDNNIVKAIASVNQIKSKLENTKSDIKKIKDNCRNYLTTMEIKSKLEPILRTSKEPLYTAGVVQNVTDITNKLSLLQRDFTDTVEQVSTLDILYPKIDNLLDKMNKITELLNTIPDNIPNT